MRLVAGLCKNWWNQIKKFQLEFEWINCEKYANESIIKFVNMYFMKHLTAVRPLPAKKECVPLQHRLAPFGCDVNLEFGLSLLFIIYPVQCSVWIWANTHSICECQSILTMVQWPDRQTRDEKIINNSSYWIKRINNSHSAFNPRPHFTRTELFFDLVSISFRRTRTYDHRPSDS